MWSTWSGSQLRSASACARCAFLLLLWVVGAPACLPCAGGEMPACPASLPGSGAHPPVCPHSLRFVPAGGTAQVVQARLSSVTDPPVFPHSLCFRLCRRPSSSRSSPPAASSLWRCWCRRGRQSRGELRHRVFTNRAFSVVCTSPAAGAAAARVSCRFRPHVLCLWSARLPLLVPPRAQRPG